MKAFKIPVNITLNNNGTYKKFAVEMIAMGENREDAYKRINENLKIKFDLYETSMYEI